MTSVPDFFQDEGERALRPRLEWLEQHLGLGESFFARLLREDPEVFAAWRRTTAPLGEDKGDVLRAFWDTVMHLLSFQGFDEAKVRAFLEHTTTRHPPGGQSPFSPPWSASSLKEYLESGGAEAIREVDRWVESFRFGDPYAPLGGGGVCQ